MTDLLDVDIFDPAVYGRGVPHEDFRRLREEAPCYFHPEPEGRGFWAITRHADIQTVSRDPARFSSARGGTHILDLDPEYQASAGLAMINMDDPEHRWLRKLISAGFTPKQIERLEPRIREIATNAIDRVIEKGSCDFVQDISGEVPLVVIMELLGVPPEDQPKVLDWTLRAFGEFDPEFASTQEEMKQLSAEMVMYAMELGAARRKEPRDDIISILMAAEVDGRALNDLEFGIFFSLLAVAGNDTTRNALANGVNNLLQRPDQWETLRREPDLLRSAILEMLRFDPSVMHFRRNATEDIEMHGQTIHAGDKVVIWYVSGNRDESVFPDADTFDLRRAPQNQLAFGYGPHYCIGQALGQLEMRVTLEEVLRRMPDLRVAGPVERLQSNFINGLKRMPVSFSPGAPSGS